MIDLEKMAKEHEKLFPNADLDSQFEKYDEESKEFSEAFEHLIEELADRIIVCAGLYRFDKVIAKANISICYAIAERCHIIKEVEDRVKDKWFINLARKWKWNGKTYHHVGDDEC